MNNSIRCILAEFLVAKAFDIDSAGVRVPWSAYDLKTRDGIKIEVKSAAYLQSWKQTRLSTISFSIKAARCWDADSGVMELEARRPADVYVFALLACIDSSTVNPLDLAQWQFYVLARCDVDAYPRSKHSVTLRSLEKMVEPVAFGELRAAVQIASKRHQDMAQLSREG